MGNKSKKDSWDKADIILRAMIPIIIAFIGFYFTITYKAAQNELAKAQILMQSRLTKIQIESEILTFLITGNEDQRKLAVEFALVTAEKFGDKDFKKIVLEVSGTKDPNPEVRNERYNMEDVIRVE